MNLVTNGMRVNRLVVVAAVLVTGLLAWAWIDGGRVPVRPIEQPVALPGASR